MRHAGAHRFAHLRQGLSLTEFHLQRRPIARHGDDRVLIEERATFRDGASGQAEIVCLTVVEVDDEGLILSNTSFEVGDLAAAQVELHQGSGSTEDPASIPRTLAARSVGKDGWRLLAVVGDHLCLHDTGERLVLHEIDDTGEVIAFLAFDHADRRGTSEELARRANDRYRTPPSTS